MDLEKELSKALQDPDIMNKVGSVLASLGGGGNGEASEGQTLTGAESNILSALQNTASDDRTNLLMAIKPFLSEKRAPYMDSAVTILKLVKMGKIGKDLKLF